MQLQVSFIDAFTDTSFKGNPAAVLITEQWLDDTLMQSIAMEHNLSETAFVVPSGDNKYAIRWFTPANEIAFCGHATLASAYVLFKQNPLIDCITFTTLTVGDLIINRMDNHFIEMSFPNRKPQRCETDVIPESLLQGLSIKPIEVWKSEQAYFAVYDDANTLLSLSQDKERIRLLSPLDVVVTSPPLIDQPFDFISRYFAPAQGIDEDPVTGSIHAGLAPLWAEKLNKQNLKAYQASSRGGELHCVIEGNRVLVSGQAVEYMQGIINID